MRRVAALLLALTPALGGCGLHPLYAGGRSADVAQGLSAVEISDIQGKSGWLMRQALSDRIGVSGHASPRYRLDVKLDDRLEGLGVLANDTVSRERRTLRARYQLVDIANGNILLDATAGSDAGIDIVSSEYATVAAEQTALENLTRVVADRIVISLALQLHDTAKQAPGKP